MFKKLVIATSLALSACTVPLGGVLSPGQTVSATSIEIAGTDALSKATDAYAGVSLIAAEVVRQGILNHDQLLKLRTLNDQAYLYIHDANSGLSSAERATGLFTIITQIHSIVGK